MNRRRHACWLIPIVATLAVSPPSAAQWEGWTLRRGMFELSFGGVYEHYERTIDGVSIGAPFLAGYVSIADRVLLEPAARARAGVETVLNRLPGPDPAGVADGIGTGAVALGLGTDTRAVPFALRYGLSDRLTVFVAAPIERRGADFTELHLAGGTLGVNPDPAGNRAALERIDPGFGDFGGGLLLPLAGSAAGSAVQARLRAASADDTLRLPVAPVRLAELGGLATGEAGLTPAEVAALTGATGRRPYALGDVEVGARFLLLRGPSGWPAAEAGGRGVRASLGVRARLPTGRSGTTFFAELPSEAGHAGVGGELVGDVYPGGRWSLHGGVAYDHRFAADVPTLAFGPGNPFPGATEVRTLRRTPGARIDAAVRPRWRLTEEIAFQGAYHLVTRRATLFEGEEGAAPSPLDPGVVGTAHGVGVGMRYSTLQGFGRGDHAWPYEIALEATTTVAGSGAIPDATAIRFTAHFFTDAGRVRAVLPGRDAPPRPPPVEDAAEPEQP
jgi:hypothetical protein